MEMNTKYFGKLPYDEKEVLLIPDGLFGFESLKEFVIIRFENDNNVLLCLQSLKEESLAFIIINPNAFLSDYNISLTDEDLYDLNSNKDTSLLFYCICVIQDNITESTANLKCPLIINPATGKGKQVILEDPRYTLKHPFSTFMEKEG